VLPGNLKVSMQERENGKSWEQIRPWPAAYEPGFDGSNRGRDVDRMEGPRPKTCVSIDDTGPGLGTCRGGHGAIKGGQDGEKGYLFHLNSVD